MESLGSLPGLLLEMGGGHQGGPKGGSHEEQINSVSGTLFFSHHFSDVLYLYVY